MENCTNCGFLMKNPNKCDLCGQVYKDEVKKPYSIPKMSTKYQKRNKLKMEAYAEIEKKEIRWCESCGCTNRPLSRSHTLPVGQYPQFESLPENIVIECFGSSDSCHNIWENGTLAQKMKLETWEEKVKVILKYAPSYLILIMKNYKPV